MEFFHIPTPEWWEASEGPIVGDMFEGVYAPNINSGLLTEMRVMGGMKVASTGHDHVNDWCGTWYGISLCYGGGVGYTTYGRTGWNRRARLFEVYESGRIASWKRLDDDAFSMIDMQDLTGVRPLEEFCEASAPSSCPNGCAMWDDLSSDFNTRSQSAVNGKWYDGVGPNNRCCARPYYDQDSGPWCFCRGTAETSAGSSWGHCSSGLDAATEKRGTEGIQHFVEGNPCDFPLKPGATVPAYCLGK
jgi:hypothetical protein